MAQAPAQPIDPCTFGVPQRWSGVQLAGMSDAADRDGLLFLATLSPAPGTGGGGYPGLGTIAVVVSDALGVVANGSIDASFGAQVRFAWRPDAPLAANAPYTVAVTLTNVVPSNCPAVSDAVRQTFAITTKTELTPELPEPPLRAIAYGEAWSTTAMVCCEPRDTSACGGVEPCAKCWSARREPTIVPLWDAALQSTDPLEYAWFYGTVAALDANAVLAIGFGTAPAPLAFRPLTVEKAAFSESQTEVCMTGALRNARTGAVTLRARCTPVTRDGLAGVTLPNNVVLDPPADPTLVVGPAGCKVDPPLFQRADVQVAASFHTHRDTCLPGCAQLFPIEPVQPVAGSGAPPVAGSGAPPVAGSGAPPMQNAGGDTPAASDGGGDSGCRVGAAGNTPTALLVSLALLVVRRSRRRSRARRTKSFHSHPLVFSARSYPSKHRISPRNWC